MTKKKSKYILYLDVLRIIAILAVILLHVSNISFFNKQVLNSNDFYFTTFIYCFSRIGVSLFIMISGVTFLNPNKNITLSYLVKKIIRIFICLVCWLTIYDVIALLWNHEPIYFGFIKVIITNLINYKGYYFGNYHLWYLYMIIGLYLVTPIVRLFVKHADKELQLYTLGIWFFFSACLPIALLFKPFHFFNVFKVINIPIVTGIVGTYVLGYYLYKIDLKKEYRYILYSMGIMSFVILVSGTIYLSRRNGAATEMLFDNTSCFVILMATAMFILIKEMINEKNFSNKFISVVKKLSSLTFGVYLVHEFFIYYTYPYYFGFSLDYTLTYSGIRIFVVTLFVAIASFLLSYLLSYIPFVKKYLL